jgi:predicted dehydrogenase
MASTIDAEVVDYAAIRLPYSIAAACQEIPQLKLVAGADILPEKREAFRQKWGVEAVYDDYLAMIEKEKPDLVAICTRGTLHAEMTVNVAEAGVPMIFCEKAMACSMREADAAREACHKGNVAFNTGVLRRFDYRYHHVRQLIQDGAIGEPKVAVHYASTNLLHGHIHSVDTLLFLLGDPKAVSVRGELRPRDLRIENNRLDKDPNAIYHVEFENGLEAYTVPVGYWDFEVFGTQGVIKTMNNGMDCALRQATKVANKYTVFRDAPFPPFTGAPKSATVALLEDIIQAHEQGRPTLGNVDVTHHATEICLAVAESHRQGGTRVALPIENRHLYVWHV